MNFKLVIQFIIAMSIILCTSCIDNLGPGWEYQVDNPLDKEIVIKIDKKEYTIPAQTTQNIELGQGKHTLTYDGSSVNFVTKVNSNKSVTIMNPTLSNYMLHANFYIRTNVKNKDISAVFDANSYEYNSDIGTVKLPVRVLNTLFIEKRHTNWSFGLEDDVKEKVGSSYPGKKKVFHKLYREAQYMKDLAEEIPAGTVFPVNSKKLSEQPPYVFPIESLMSDCDAANEFAKNLESRWKKTIADPSDIFQEVAALGFDTTVEQGQQSKLAKACSTQFNPGHDDKPFKEAMKRMSRVTKYLVDASSFIVE